MFLWINGSPLGLRKKKNTETNGSTFRKIKESLIAKCDIYQIYYRDHVKFMNTSSKVQKNHIEGFVYSYSN